MKKILFIIWSYSLGGGAESLLTMIVNHLDPGKYQIGIIEFYHSKIKREPVNSNIKLYEPITFEGDKEYKKKLYYAHKEPEEVIRKYIPSGYDLYISFNYQIPSFLLPKGTRNIAWVHGTVYDLAEEGMDYYRHLQSEAFEKVTKIISISDITTDSIKTVFPEHVNKLLKIYNALDIEQIRKKASGFTEIILGHPSVIWVGRLDDNKNPMRMIEIFQKVVREENSAHLYFLGQGKLEGQMVKKINEYGLQGQIHILGYVPNPFPVMKQADICCMTSESEGFGMVLLESVALQVPFVSTLVGGSEIIADNEQCGRVYTTDEEAKEFIIELLNMPRELLDKACEKSICRFDLCNYISKIEKLFDEVLESKDLSKHSSIWGDKEEVGELAERKYYYHFPENLIPRGCKIILYGAGDVGTDYFYYIKETGICQIAAWVDVAAEKYSKDVSSIDRISEVEYDRIIIAVMDYKTKEDIRTNLVGQGVENSKILWTKPIF